MNRELLEKMAVYGLLIMTAVILFTRLGTYPLQMQWEPNYGQVMREMVWGEGDSITPTCKVGSDEGAAPGTFWSKPIMIFWMAYPLYSLFGDSEWCARLPIAMVGLFGVFMTFWLMSRLYTRRVGLLSGLLLITSPSYLLISRAFMVDIPFVAFMWVGLLFLLAGDKEKKPLFIYLFYLFMGLSALAKGLLPLILVGGTLFFYCLISGDWNLLKRMKLHRGAVIFLIVALPWYAYMTQRYGMEYLKKFFWDHHVERSMGKLDKPNDTYQMFVLYFTIGILPWLTFLPQAVTTLVPWKRKEADRGSLELLFLTGFLLIFSFFSAISTKFPHYIFPAVPFVTVLLALYIDRLLSADAERHVNRLVFFVALLVLIVVGPDLLDMKNYRTLFYFITTERLQDWHPNVADPTRFFTVIYILWGAVLGVAFVWRRFNAWILGALALLSIVYASYISFQMIPTLTEMFSARSLLQTYLELRKSPDEPIAEFTQTWKSRSIKYYIPFDELKDRYEYKHYRIADSKASVQAFYKRNKDRRVFIIIEQKQKHFTKINAMWQEASGGEQLIFIADDRVAGEEYKPEFWLVSNRDNNGQSKRLSKDELEDKRKSFVRTENPWEPARKLAAEIEAGELKIYGSDPLPETFKAGGELNITLYFKVEKKPTREWEIFVHAERLKEQFRLRGDHPPVEGNYPASKWAPGEYIKDVYSLEIPADTPEGPLDIYVGLYKGDYRGRLNDVPERDPEGRLKLGVVEITKEK